MSQAFQWEVRPDKIGVLTFDLPDKKVNTLGQQVLAELGERLRAIGKEPGLRGLLLRSGKPGQFIAGADLNELAALAYATKEQVGVALGYGHKLFASLASLPFPTVALIDGQCMGGGTELVLSMDERIASNASHTSIALPETKLGLLPAWGGTQRLPRLIGVPPSIEIICGGEPVKPDKAVALGLVFDAVPADRLVDEGVRLLEYLIKTGDWEKSRQRRRQPVGMSDDELNFAFAVAEGAIRGKTKGQYPAPLIALKAMKEGCNRTLDEGLKVEQQAALELVGSPISANLIGVFFMQNRLGRDPGVSDPNIKPREIKRIGVLGSGLMGAGIATAHARSGIPAAMVDVDEPRLQDGLKRAAEVVESRIKIGHAKVEDLARMLALLSTSTSSKIFADADLVIEAVTENEGVKTGIYRELAGILKDDAILASNTSTISITRMADAAPHAERFIGMHFFSPVDRMQLVEVIRGAKTSDETVATVVALAKKIRKTPIVVNDCPGFLVNRVLFPYMNEALALLEEGVPMDAVDDAATKFGMPVGPIALQDMVGLDTSFFAGKILAQAYADRSVSSRILGELVKAGRLGKKTGAGFRKYAGKGKIEADPAVGAMLKAGGEKSSSLTPPDITDRLFLPMLLEATRVLEEGIVREPADVDMGLILGIGFPPFRGGILRWADSVGAGEILKRLDKYRSLGKRFEPTDSLIKHNTEGTTFYPRPKLAATA
jgi:3-hydroxyacyl-CoA dehydrogenase/enoyl-CoA hydratase/3-hydroxybutyryl-CoA epimerase/enoyl-CoA isomerase